MSGFPLTDPDVFPVPLGELLSRLGERGHLSHLSITRTQTGEWQASCRGEGDKAYTVSIESDMIRAILKAVGPDFGKEWASLLGEEYQDTFDIDDDEELEDVL